MKVSNFQDACDNLGLTQWFKINHLPMYIKKTHWFRRGRKVWSGSNIHQGQRDGHSTKCLTRMLWKKFSFKVNEMLIMRPKRMKWTAEKESVNFHFQNFQVKCTNYEYRFGRIFWLFRTTVTPVYVVGLPCLTNYDLLILRKEWIRWVNKYSQRLI